MGADRRIGWRFAAAVGLIPLVAFLVPTPVAGTGVGRSSVAAQPVVGPELPVAAPVLGVPRSGNDPAIAFGGSVHLVAWGGSVARVDRSGTVLDQSPIPMTQDFVQTPDLASDGHDFLAVWRASAGIVGARVSQDGRILDPEPIRLSSGSDGSEHPALAFDGTNYLVVWSSTSGIRATRVSPEGGVVGPADVLVTPGGSSEIDVAFNGTHHLLVWTAGDPADVVGTLVTVDGVALHPGGVPISTGWGTQGAPVVTSVGSSFFVAWLDARGGVDEPIDVYGSRVDAAGSAVDPAGIRILEGPGNDVATAVASDGTDVIVTWSGRGARVDRSGAVLDPSGFPLSTLRSDVAVAFNGDHYFVVGSAGLPIGGARVARNGAVLDPAAVTISRSASAQTELDMAFDGTSSFVVWTDDRGPGSGIYGGRIGPDGQMLDGTGIPIAVEDDPNARLGRPSVAFDGTNFLVAWSELRNDGPLRGALLSRDGVVLDRLEIAPGVTGENQHGPEVAYGGGTFLVVWNWFSWDGAADRYEVRAALVDPSGSVGDRFLVTAHPFDWPVDVEFGDTAFMVVWQNYREGSGQDVFATRVTTSGTVPAPRSIPIATATGDQTVPRIAWNGDVHLVVWTHVGDPGQFRSDIAGARVADDGTLLDPSGITISAAPDQQYSPTVAANGPFLVAWHDRRRGGRRSDVFATRVDADATVAHPDGFPVATSTAEFPAGPASAPARGPGDFSVAYERFLAEQPYGTTRAFLRSVSPK